VVVDFDVVRSHDKRKEDVFVSTLEDIALDIALVVRII